MTELCNLSDFFPKLWVGVDFLVNLGRGTKPLCPPPLNTPLERDRNVRPLRNCFWSAFIMEMGPRSFEHSEHSPHQLGACSGGGGSGGVFHPNKHLDNTPRPPHQLKKMGGGGEKKKKLGKD